MTPRGRKPRTNSKRSAARQEQRPTFSNTLVAPCESKASLVA